MCPATISTQTLQTANQTTGISTSLEDEKQVALFMETTLFPFYGEMFLKTDMHQLFYYFLGIIAGLQNFAVGFMLNSPLIWKELPTLLRILKGFVDWDITRHGFDDNVAQFTIGAVIFLIFIVSFMVVLINFSITRNFQKKQLLWTRILAVIISPMIIPFYGSATGYLAVIVYNDPTSVRVAALSFYAIMMIVMSLLSILSLTLNDYSVIYTVSPMGCWDYKVHIVICLALALNSMLQQFVSILAEWMTLVVALFQITVYFYVTYLEYFTPHHHFIMNSAQTWDILTSMSFTICAIVLYFMDDFDWVICFVLSLIVGLLITIGFMISIEFRKKKILKVLTKEELSENGEEINLPNKIDIFESIQFNSTNDALAYIRIGLIYHCDFIVDFSFLRYMLDNYANKQIVCAISQVAGVFPEELQFLSYCLSLLQRRPDHNIGEHFVVYQLKRIHTLRQSSVSSDAAKALTTLTKMSNEAISLVRSFWIEIEHAKTDISFTSLHYIRKRTVKTEAAFKDAIDQYPNNAQIHSEFLRFQLECQGDFKSACFTAKKLSLLDQGKTLVDDYAFLCFVNMFPNYIYDHIMDTHGKRIATKNSDLESTTTLSATSVSTGFSMSSDERNMLDFDKNDDLIHDYFSHPKLRLAIQNKLRSITMPSILLTFIMCVVQLVILIGLSVAAILVTPNGAKKSQVFYDMFYKISKLGAAFQFTTIDISMIFIPLTAVLLNKPEFANLNAMVLQELNIKLTDIPNTPSIFVEPQISLNNYAMDLKKYFDDVLDCIENEEFSLEKDIFEEDDIIRFKSKLALVTPPGSIIPNPVPYNVTRSNYSIHSYFSELVDTSISYNQLYDKYIPLKDHPTPVNMLTLFQTIGISSIDVILNSIYITDQLVKLERQLEADGKDFIHDKRMLLLGCIYGLAVVFFVLLVSMDTINLHVLNKDMLRISKILRSVPKQDIDESMEPISLRTQESSMKGNIIHGAHDPNYSLVIFLIGTYGVLFAITALIVVANVLFIDRMDSEGYIFEWFALNSIRYLFSVNAIPLYFISQTGMWSIKGCNEISSFYIDAGNIANIDLKKSILNGDRDFQVFFFGSDDPNIEPVDDENYATVAKRMSINSRYDTVLTLLKGTQETNNTAFRMHAICEIFFLFSTYVFSDFDKILDQIMMVGSTFYDLATVVLFAMAFVSIFLALLGFGLEVYILQLLQMSVKTIGQLFSMIPPDKLVESSYFWDIIAENESNDDEFSMTASQMILYRSTSACLMMCPNMVIQSVNKALTAITGFTPDQILGQNITFLIPPPSVSSSSGDDSTPTEQFLILIEDMKKDKGEDQSTLKLKLLTESGRTIIVKATILCMRKENAEIDAFTLIFRDLSVESEQKRRIKATKERVDSLLVGLVPPEVIGVIKEQKGTALFISEVSTVIFVELTGLMQYVHTMSPKQMMSCLELVYAKFGEICDEYPAVHPLKTNDDLFVSVSGLFDFKDSPELQAEQAVLFALDLLKRIEEVNVQLTIDIQLRIGINQGGPLVGSVLNPTMPTFDILGGVIGLAVKMQSDGPVGCIQISEAVAKQLDTKKFEITPGTVLPGARGKPDKTFIVANRQ